MSSGVDADCCPDLQMRTMTLILPEETLVSDAVSQLDTVSTVLNSYADQSSTFVDRPGGLQSFDVADDGGWR
jgi:hypothetical protein